MSVTRTPDTLVLDVESCNQLGVPGLRGESHKATGASGRPGDPLGDPTVALRRSHHRWPGSTTGNYVEHRVVPYQAVSDEPARFCGGSGAGG